MSNNTGGPAFPTERIGIESGDYLTYQEEGMTLRDYFAAKALDVSIQQTRDFYGIDKDHVAKWCYEMADAMLKARGV